MKVANLWLNFGLVIIPGILFNRNMINEKPKKLLDNILTTFYGSTMRHTVFAMSIYPSFRVSDRMLYPGPYAGGCVKNKLHKMGQKCTFLLFFQYKGPKRLRVVVQCLRGVVQGCGP